MKITHLDFLDEYQEKNKIIGGSLFSENRRSIINQQKLNERGDEIISRLFSDLSISANGLAFASTDETTIYSIDAAQISLSSSISGFATTPN